MKLLIVVTHLLGTGHLSRALTLGRAFAQAGHQVHVASGGMAAPHLDSDGVELVQLPPLRSDGVDFTRLLDAQGALATPQYHSRRQQMLQDTVTRIKPDVVITELFPFGRRSLREEFTRLLASCAELARPPLVLSSIRDILAPPSKQSKADFADAQIAQFYDGVLTHSDPEVTPLSLSWPVNAATQAKVHYTGFVAPEPPPPHPQADGQGEVLVSAGGGDVGTRLFMAAKEAARLDPTRDWRILVAGQQRDRTIDALMENAPANLHVQAARPDFRSMLNHAAASVSMCGYNTGMDVLQTGVRAVFVPFDAGGEVEQTLRANALARHDAVAVLPDSALTPEALLHAVQSVLAAPERAVLEIGFDGANETVAIVQTLLARKRQP